MQVKLSVVPEIRYSEFVHRALLFPSTITLEVEPHQLSEPARAALAIAHPELPDLFELLAPGTTKADGKLWKINVNPNAYTAGEVVEMWTKEFMDAQQSPQEQAAQEQSAQDE